MPRAGGSKADCLPCAANYYSSEGAAECTQCPRAGVSCAGARLQLLPEFWHDNTVAARVGFNAALDLYACATPGSCVVNETTFEQSCAPGYTSMLCGVCAPGYGKADGACTACYSSTTNIVLLVFMLGALISAGFFAIVRVIRGRETATSAAGTGALSPREPMSTLKMLFNFLQMTSFLADFDLDWPTVLRGLFSTAGNTIGVSLDTQFVSCALNWTIYDRFLTFFLIPVAGAVAALFQCRGRAVRLRALRAREGMCAHEGTRALCV